MQIGAERSHRSSAPALALEGFGYKTLFQALSDSLLLFLPRLVVLCCRGWSGEADIRLDAVYEQSIVTVATE